MMINKLILILLLLWRIHPELTIQKIDPCTSCPVRVENLGKSIESSLQTATAPIKIFCSSVDFELKKTNDCWDNVTDFEEIFSFVIDEVFRKATSIRLFCEYVFRVCVIKDVNSQAVSTNGISCDNCRILLTTATTIVTKVLEKTPKIASRIVCPTGLSSCNEFFENSKVVTELISDITLSPVALDLACKFSFKCEKIDPFQLSV
ncbi:hypothetical protein CRE_29319 [Caenorhabditis remanei]|uniref:Uncharacterized protein n=1 Tax=Caenorhabditis remanei TaxID=31234 RepID=E3MY41_CAERE|nr:hypothetical protein CRE_29319 [Caenorhabditis remanei]